jgi:hypothetical protein
MIHMGLKIASPYGKVDNIPELMFTLLFSFLMKSIYS